MISSLIGFVLSVDIQMECEIILFTAALVVKIGALEMSLNYLLTFVIKCAFKSRKLISIFCYSEL